MVAGEGILWISLIAEMPDGGKDRMDIRKDAPGMGASRDREEAQA